MPEWLQHVLTTATVTGASIFIIQKYLLARIKHDFDLKLEKIRPLTAEETLRRENFLNAKRDAFYEAISVVNQFLEAVPWEGPDVPPDRPVRGERPSEATVNVCLAKISMFCDDGDIPTAFLACFQNASPVSLGEFVSLLRRDLGYGDLPFDSKDYKRYFAREPEDLTRKRNR